MHKLGRGFGRDDKGEMQLFFMGKIPDFSSVDTVLPQLIYFITTQNDERRVNMVRLLWVSIVRRSEQTNRFNSTKSYQEDKL